MLSQLAHRFRAIALFSVMLMAFGLGTGTDAARAASPTLNAESFMPSPFEGDLVTVARPRISKPLLLTGALNFHYGHSLLLVAGTDASGQTAVERLVGSRLTAELLLAFSPLEFLDIGIAMPFALMGESTLIGLTGYADPSGFQIGEMRLSIKGAAVQMEAFGFGIQLDTTLPTSSADGFAGDGLTFHPKLLFDFVAAERLAIALNVGARFRLEDTELIPANTVGGVPYLTASHELTLGLGASVRLVDEFYLLGEAYMRTPLMTPFTDEDGTMMEAVGAFRYSPIDELTFTVGAGGGTPLFTGYGTAAWRAFGEVRFQWTPDGDADGDGVSDGDDKCAGLPEDHDGYKDDDGCPDPDNDGDGFLDEADGCPEEAEDFDGFQDTDGCPDRDNDGDGVSDSVDKCPMEPEDADGFEDGDGCIDPDNDGDGVIDEQDRCPDARENNNGFEDHDGCPDFPGVARSGDGISLKTPVAFTKDRKKEVAPASFATVRAIVALMRTNPTWGVLRVDVHSSGRGRDKTQVAECQTKADAIRRLLVIEGLDPQRIQTRAVGGAEPLGNPRKKAGRAMNERIEWLVGPKAAPAPEPTPEPGPMAPIPTATE